MTASLEDKAGLVTGAAGGIGRAVAVAAAQAGASVVIADLESQRAKGEETVRLVQENGGEARFVACDVTQPGECETLVAATIAQFGRLDFAHNNAGIGSVGHIIDAEETEFDRVLAVNLKGVWHGLRAQLPRMAAAGGGSIVNTASLAGLIGLPRGGAYAASKHAVVGITKTAAVEWAAQNVRVNAVCPAAIATPMTDSLPEELREQALAPQAIRRFGQSHEVAAAVVWLCSDASSFVTGVAMPVDGGATAG